MKHKNRKNINIKNMPMFILIGLIAMIVIIAVIYYVFLRYSPEQIITYSGYALEGKVMVENLKSDKTENIKQYIDLIPVNENDLLYKKLNTYYIGEKEKKEVDINYPMYINEGSTILNLGKKTKLITVNYEQVEGYPEFMLTGGIMYNGADLTRADGNEYIFLKSADEIYTNIKGIKIKTVLNEYEIKQYSNIYFTEEAIIYYEMQDGYMEYKRIEDVDNNSEIEIAGEKQDYKTFLEKIGIKQTEENSIEQGKNDEDEDKENKEDEVENENTSNEEVIQNGEGENNNTTNNGQSNNEWQEGEWVKPEVNCTNFEGDVYTIRSNLTVTDRAKVITKGIIFEIMVDGRLNRRVQATQTGEINITGLKPDTEYEIKGIVYYNNEEGEEQEEEFYTGKVKTKSMDTLGTIDFSFENGEIYSNKIELIHLKIKNDINEEVVKGISRIQLEIDGIEYRLSNEEVAKIKNGEEITYQTNETIKSNSTIKFKIAVYDRFGNELKENNNEGKTTTAKLAPSANIRPTKQEVTEVNIEVKLTNKDNVRLENYRYEIIDTSKNIVKTGQLKKVTEKLIFTDLDANGYFTIIVYANYDLENGKGKQENIEIGRGSFVTKPIASLGHIQVKVEEKEITQTEMKLGISIDDNQTDARLIKILDKVEIVIYDEGKNITNNEAKETEIKRITLTKEEVEKLKIAEQIELDIDKLTSNTKYKVDVVTTVKQGTVETVVEDNQNIQEIITLKIPAEVQIRNQFVIGDMIDLDIRVKDEDGAILVNKVRIELRDEQNKLIKLEEMATNGEYERKIYENLEEEKNYRIIIYAPEYNEGSKDETYKADYVLKEIRIYTEIGISGKLDLLALEKTGTGKNLIDVASKVNWYQNCFNTAFNYGLNYDENTKILTLGPGIALSYYDLTKYVGEEITISFKAKSSNSTFLQIEEKNTNDMLDTTYTSRYTLKGLNNEWKEYSYTGTLNKTGYIGFSIGSVNPIVEIQDLQIELGDTKTNYEEFKYILNANMNITVNDVRDEITTNDYYVRVYKDGEQIQEIRYEELGEENKVENAKKSYEVEENGTYKIELLVKVQDRYYELDSQEFTTEESKEIKGIADKNDFLKIQPYGEYIVLNDIDLSEEVEQYRFGSTDNYFEGKIDFNGKTLTKDIKNNNTQVFNCIGSNGIIENMVFDIKMNNDIEKTLNGGFTYTNYGTIRNIQVNVIESVEQLNGNIFILMQQNFGLIENFAVNLQENIYTTGQVAIIANGNYGTIRNGYMYGKNIKILTDSNLSVNVGGLILYNQREGMIENIFSLVNVDSKYENEINGNIVNVNNDMATVRNVYSVGIGENTNNLKYGPNIYYKYSKRVYNNYYFADEIFTSELELKGNKLSLWDTEFQNQIINAGGAFKVDELVNEGYYPQLNMPEVMPAQEFIPLPEVEDADLPDILSTKVLEQGTDTVKVEFSVNNPSAEQVVDIKIENMNVNILSQEYNDKKSKVIAELRYPAICVSSYEVLSISTKGAFNNTYTRQYEEGERVIYVDLYKEIWSIEDWKNINKSPTENYMLMTDLDFINEGNTINISTVNGILDGNGHTISNVRLQYNATLINTLNGKLKNLQINNFNQEAITQGGVVLNAYSGSIIDNVHLKNAYITIIGNGNVSVGGIIKYGTANIINNCSVTNIEINTNIEGMLADMYLGGIAGNINISSIENCYVQGLKIKDVQAINSGIGGIVGLINTTMNTIKNCYTEGRIISKNMNVGGIAGKAQNNDTIIENCYSKVDISSTNNYIGGIVGVHTGNNASTIASNITNNLSIGNLYTTTGVENLGRIIGNQIELGNNNYSYENQLLNGYITSEEKGATLLTVEEINSLNLGDSYYYEKDINILPKLYNTSGTELLPNQTDIFIKDSKEPITLEIESTQATKPNTTEAEVSITINNPQEVEITEIEIEDMETTITRNVTQDGITNVVVRATPNRYYDSYKLTKIKYKVSTSEDGQAQEQIKEVEAEIKVQFYKEIYTFEDWQSIEEGTYQNYRLMADIDFSGKTNIKNNITVNRLEAESNIYTLKNIELEFNAENMGLINNVKTSIKNIGFENITLKNTKGSGNYFGIIATNTGDVQNLQFNQITIEAEGMSYVGMIGKATQGNIENIEIKDIKVKGKDYVGGFIGNISLSVGDASINNITGDNVTVEGTGNCVGGIMGYQSGSSLIVTNLTIENSNITGKGNYTGGIVGQNAATSKYLKVNNTNITGNSYTGGIVGIGNASYAEIYSSTINAMGSYIGGITGLYDSSYVVVNDVTINAPSLNSERIGGISGNGGATYFQVKDSKIISNGKYVGGITNNLTGYTGTHDGYIENSYVQGNSYVGGIFGAINSGYIYKVYVNAEVKANSHTAGGAIGYVNNESMTTLTNKLYIYNTIVTDTTVTSPLKAGGLIGDIAADKYIETYYYNNYIDADVTSEDESTASLILGGRPDLNPLITNTYVYKYSTLNGQYVYKTNDNIKSEQYLVRADLDDQTTFSSRIGLGTTYWNYTLLEEGKYPTIKDEYLYMPELQNGIDLPTDPENTELNNEEESNANMITNQSIENLPNITAYPIAVDEINIDFSNIIQGVKFTYYINGEEKDTVELTEKTYTFKYNYKDEIKIKITNGQEENSITIKPEDVTSQISLEGTNNAYITGNKLYINGEEQEGEYVNVYKGYALKSSGEVINIETNQAIESNTELTTLEEQAKPLSTYSYKENNIEVFGTYSKVNGNIKLQIYNVRNGKLSAISTSVNMKVDNSIVDSYNNKEYQTILTTEGEIMDIKEKLKYPENLLNRNIKQITQNTDTEKTEIMLIYNTGKVVIFNYVTGDIIYDNQEKADTGLMNYIIGSIGNIWNDYEEKQEEYANSQDLITKLKEEPIEEVLEENTTGSENANNNDGSNTGTINTGNNTNSSNTSSNINNNYITVYNGETEEYEVYSEKEILEGEEEKPISETTKIKTNGLEKLYSYETKENGTKINGAVVVIGIIIASIISLLILRKLIYINSRKKKI